MWHKAMNKENIPKHESSLARLSPQLTLLLRLLARQQVIVVVYSLMGLLTVMPGGSRGRAIGGRARMGALTSV